MRVAFGVLRRLDDARQYRTELDRSHGVAREVAEQIFEELLALLVVRSTEGLGIERRPKNANDTLSIIRRVSATASSMRLVLPDEVAARITRAHQFDEFVTDLK